MHDLRLERQLTPYLTYKTDPSRRRRTKVLHDMNHQSGSHSFNHQRVMDQVRVCTYVVCVKSVVYTGHLHYQRKRERGHGKRNAVHRPAKYDYLSTGQPSTTSININTSLTFNKQASKIPSNHPFVPIPSYINTEYLPTFSKKNDSESRKPHAAILPYVPKVRYRKRVPPYQHAPPTHGYLQPKQPN